MRVSLKHLIRSAIAVLITAVPFVVVSSTAEAASYVVNSTADTNSSGTLRWAINQANAMTGADTITFASGFNGTITLTSDLPTITDDLTITGPGESQLTIEGAATATTNSGYRPFTIATTGATLTISNMTISNSKNIPFGPNEGGAISNTGSTVSATNVTFKNHKGIAVFNLSSNSLATYTDCTFRQNEVGISSDHGNTPDSVQPESAYENRTYVVNSTFIENTQAIYTERFVKISGSTFNNNTYGGIINGLNRSQILNSTFIDNDTGLSFFNWTPVQWTNVGPNNRYINNNTFINNKWAIEMYDSWNDGKRSQQWTTITNNKWDGNEVWIWAEKWNSTTSVNDTIVVSTLNSAGKEWHESGNTLYVAPTTTTTTVAPTTTTTVINNSNNSNTTTTAVANSNNSISASNGSTNSKTTTTVAGKNQSMNDLAASETPSTTSPTTTIPAPDAPEVSQGESGAIVNGESVDSELTRENNALVVSAAGIEASIFGLAADGSRIDLDADGNLHLTEDSRIGIDTSGFQPNAEIEVWLFSTPTKIGTIVTNSAGKAFGRFGLPEGIEAGDHRVVLKGANNKSEDVVIGIGIGLGAVDNGTNWARLLIAIPVALAVIFGLIIPTTLKRRRQEESV